MIHLLQWSLNFFFFFAVENEAPTSSPGLRRKLLASDLANRSGSTFFVNQENHSLSLPNSSRKLLLSKPRRYSPPLQKRPTPDKLSKSTFYAPSVIQPKDDSVIEQTSGLSKLTAQRSRSLPHTDEVLPLKKDLLGHSKDSVDGNRDTKGPSGLDNADLKKKTSKNSSYFV